MAGMRSPLPGPAGRRRCDAQAGVRQHSQRDVPVPGVVAAEPVLIEAGFRFGTWKHCSRGRWAHYECVPIAHLCAEVAT